MMARNQPPYYFKRLSLWLFVCAQLQAANASQNLNTSAVNDWGQVSTASTSSNDVEWVPCFSDNFFCTRFEVPLDWADENAGTTKVAFIKYPSSNESAADMIINFGGPGGSGVGNLLGMAPSLAEFFGPDVNLISFDPRGVNNTGPSLDCFPDNPSTRQIFESIYFRTISDPESRATQYRLAEGLGNWCNPVLGGPNGSAKYANTPAVAHDLLAFTELLNAEKGLPREESQLWYTGYSYGTVLGTTFAALYPDRVGRLILDGVADGEDYYKGSWSNNLIDADAAVEALISSCLEAGPDSCPIYESSNLLISRRISNIITSLQRSPIPVTDETVVAMPALATYADWVNVLLLGLYIPIDTFPMLIQILADLEQGRGESLIQAGGFVFGTPVADPGYNPNWATIMIQCVDAGGRNRFTSLAEYEEYSDYLRLQSKYVGEAWAMWVVSCISLDVVPPESGQFMGSLPPSANETSFPILFIGNTADPVTPLELAYKMASFFPGSGVIEIDGVGHTSLATPSRCVSEKVQAYLSGSSPPTAVTCRPDQFPLQAIE